MKNKKLGMLLGLHVGDSLGATLEFSGSVDNPDDYHKEIIGGGVFNWEAGDSTDDTDMMICLLRSISKNKEYIHEDVIKKYIEWLGTNPKDIGRTIREALKIQIRTGLKFDGMKEESCSSNGSLMRCCPLALFEYNSEMINKQTSITHGNEICKTIDELFIFSLRMALANISKENILKNVILKAKDLNSPDYLISQLEDIPNRKLNQLDTSGWVVSSLISSLWSLFHSINFEEALIKVVNRGDDSDTIGAISGALLGAYYGLDNIPERWISVIKRKDEIISLFNSFDE